MDKKAISQGLEEIVDFLDVLDWSAATSRVARLMKEVDDSIDADEKPAPSRMRGGWAQIVYLPEGAEITTIVVRGCAPEKGVH